MQIGQFGTPGVSAAVFSTARELFWGGDQSRQKIVRGQMDISSTLVDAGSTPTTHVRSGMMLGKLTSSGKGVHWDPTASDGSQYFNGVLEHELVMTEGFSATATDRHAPVVYSAPFKASSLLVLGVALVGGTFEFLARRMLHLSGSVLDDDPLGYLAGVTPRNIAKTVTGAITTAENGARFIVNGAGAVVLTLPTIKPGLRYSFLNTADQNLTVASAEGDNMVAVNDLSADSFAYSTSSQKIGAQGSVESMYVNDVLKWVASVHVATATIAT
jgi:hypothetical protein